MGSMNDSAMNERTSDDARAGRLKAMVILTENHTLVPPDDLRGLVDLAVQAEEAGVDAVMLSEHVCLGTDSGVLGRPSNPRAYAAPGNQDPATSWPSSVVMASAIAAATSRVRIALAALITPLRNPLVLAKDLATLDRLSEGRLVVQPTVSWSRDEYAAVGVPFEQRGALLDDGLAAMQALWGSTPAAYDGRFFSFSDVYCEPSPYRTDGPTLWFGGQRLHRPMLRRLVAHGQGFHPFGSPTDDELFTLRHEMASAGRSMDELELIGGTRATFTGANDVANLGESMAPIVDQVARGYTTFCMKPSQHVNDPGEVFELCQQMVAYLNSLSNSLSDSRSE